MGTASKDEMKLIYVVGLFLLCQKLTIFDKGCMQGKRCELVTFSILLPLDKWIIGVGSPCPVSVSVSVLHMMHVVSSVIVFLFLLLMKAFFSYLVISSMAQIF